MGKRSKSSLVSNFKAFLIFLSVRLSSVFLVQTWFVPDDYWQSLEVAHNLAFGYGYLTWEWTLGIRSYLQPFCIAIIYKLLEYFNVDYAELLIFTPRILQAILTAYADYCFFQWSGKRRWAILSICTSWFLFYTGSRTIINILETSLTTIALYKFPWTEGDKGTKTFISIVALLCSIRPTAAIQWFPLCFYHVFRKKDVVLKKMFKYYLPIGSLVLTGTIILDSSIHESFVITGLEFLKLNVFENIGENYGVHPWHWYITCGFPTILGIHLIPFLLAVLYVLKNWQLHKSELLLLTTICFTLLIYSLLPHKEFRFIMPLLPMALHVSSMYLTRWSCKTTWFRSSIVAAILIIGNILPALYLGLVHQRGTLDVMERLRNIAEKNPDGVSLLFLMPCHSTPLYSHLHVNVSTRFLTCTPNLNKTENYMDEADVFFANPQLWIKENVQDLPSHIVTFDVIEPLVENFLISYKPIHKLFHTSFPDGWTGRYVMVHEKII